MQNFPQQTGDKRIRRRTFLIDRRFQIKYTLIIVLVGVGVSLALGALVYLRSTENTELTKLTYLENKIACTPEEIQPISPDKTDQPKSPQDQISTSQLSEQALMTELRKFDSHVLYWLIGFVIVMAIFLFTWGIFITHRVAGPIFIITRYLRQISEGQLPQLRPLRKNDELKDFFHTFTAMVSSIRQKNIKEAEVLKKSADVLHNTGNENLVETAQSLSALAQDKKAWGEPRPPQQ